MTGGRDAQSPWRTALVVASVGIEMAVAVAVGYFVGDWLDARLGTSPWLMFLMLGCGMAAGFRGLWKTARRYWPADRDG